MPLVLGKVAQAHLVWVPAGVSVQWATSTLACGSFQFLPGKRIVLVGGTQTLAWGIGRFEALSLEEEAVSVLFIFEGNHISLVQGVPTYTEIECWES